MSDLFHLEVCTLGPATVSLEYSDVSVPRALVGDGPDLPQLAPETSNTPICTFNHLICPLLTLTSEEYRGLSSPQ